MTDSSPLRALTCPNCGAPMEFPEERSSVRCRFCDSVIERSSDSATDDDLGRALKVDVLGGQVSVTRAGGGGSGSRRFVIKMRDGQPLVIETAADAEPAEPPARKITPVAPPPVIITRPRRYNSGCSWVFTLFVAGIVGLIAAMSATGTRNLGSLISRLTGGQLGTQVPALGDALTQVPGLDDILTQVPAATSRYQVNGSAALVPAVSDAPTDILALVYEYSLTGSDTSRHLVALSGARPALQWSSAPLDKDTYFLSLQADREMAYTVSGTQLLALRRADGQTAWTVSLSDKIESTICPNCLRLADGRLFALTADGTLQAYDAASGKPLWKYRAVQDSPRGLYLLAGQPAFMDRDEKGHGLLRAFDPATGKMQTAQPGCKTDFSQPDYADWTTVVHLAPDGQSLYFVFGFFRTCVVRLDAATLKQVWLSQLPEKLDRLDPAVPPVFGSDAVYFSAGAQLVRVGATDGKVQPLPAQTDYTLTPLAVAGNALLARARRTRGTERYEIWAVNPISGKQLWTYNLEQDPPLEVNSSIIDEDKPVWTWRVTDAGLVILKFKRAADDKSHAILLDTLALDTGVAGPEQTIPLGVETIILSAPEGLGWKGSTFWFVIEGEVLALDTARGALTYRWP